MSTVAEIVEQKLDDWGFSPAAPELRHKKASDIHSWLGNFEISEKGDALLLLRNVLYFTDLQIRAIVASICAELKKIVDEPLEHCCFLPLGLELNDTGTTYLHQVSRELMLNPSNFSSDVSVLTTHPYEAAIFFDDIIGTGSQACKLYNKHLAALPMPKYYASVVAFSGGLKKVRGEAGFKGVVAGKTLSDEWRAFHEASQIFNDVNERKRVRALAEKYGRRLYPAHPLGYDDSQALIAFPHNCPNNSLPVIWAGPNNEKEAGVIWHPLFERRKVIDRKSGAAEARGIMNAKRSGSPAVIEKPLSVINETQRKLIASLAILGESFDEGLAQDVLSRIDKSASLQTFLHAANTHSLITATGSGRCGLLP